MDIETPAASVNDPWWRLHNSTIALLAVALGSAILVLMYVPNAFYVTGICSLIWLLKNNHGREVYLLFYTFFGIASISFLIALYLQSAGIVDIKHFDLHDLSGLDHGNKLVASIRWLIHVTTDAAGEFEFVGVILALAFIPQILSYIFSGPFGCGRPPAFVKTLTHAALISFMKFFCCYAGINLGVAFCFFVDVIHAPQLYSSVAEKAGRAIQPLFLAFLLAGINAGLWP